MVKNKWTSKAMHSKFFNQLDKEYVNVEISFKWMKHSGFKAETEGLITAAQIQALNTRYYSKHTIKQVVTERCRMCNIQPETVENIISGCQTVAVDKYLNRQPSSSPGAPSHMKTLLHKKWMCNTGINTIQNE